MENELSISALHSMHVSHNESAKEKAWEHFSGQICWVRDNTKINLEIFYFPVRIFPLSNRSETD